MWSVGTDGLTARHHLMTVKVNAVYPMTAEVKVLSLFSLNQDLLDMITFLDTEKKSNISIIIQSAVMQLVPVGVIILC